MCQHANVMQSQLSRSRRHLTWFHLTTSQLWWQKMAKLAIYLNITNHEQLLWTYFKATIPVLIHTQHVFFIGVIHIWLWSYSNTPKWQKRQFESYGWSIASYPSDMSPSKQCWTCTHILTAFTTIRKVPQKQSFRGNMGNKVRKSKAHTFNIMNGS